MKWIELIQIKQIILIFNVEKITIYNLQGQ